MALAGLMSATLSAAVGARIRLRRAPVSRKMLLSLFLLPLLLACSDQRAAFEIDSSRHALTLIRVQDFFWQRSAAYSLVAARMPDCMRRHDLGRGPAEIRVEVFAPGNGAWILRAGRRMFVVETRTCEGFARLDEEPADGLGPLLGSFELRDGQLTFLASPEQGAPAEPGSPGRR